MRTCCGLMIMSSAALYSRTTKHARSTAMHCTSCCTKLHSASNGCTSRCAVLRNVAERQLSNTTCCGHCAALHSAALHLSALHCAAVAGMRWTSLRYTPLRCPPLQGSAHNTGQGYTVLRCASALYAFLRRNSFSAMSFFVLRCAVLPCAAL
jgi:hypothetical protein